MPLPGETIDHTPSKELMLDDRVKKVNRAPGSIGPFNDIEKNESRTARGNLTGYGIEIYDPSRQDDDSESPYRYVGKVSKNYLLVTNEEAVETVHNIIERSGLGHRPQKVFFDGKRMVYNTIFPDLSTEGPRGDDMTIGLQVRNSYNGSMRFQASLFAQRLVCSNGMVSQKHFAQHQFKHTQGNRGWEDEMDDALAVLDQAEPTLENFIEAATRLDNVPVSERDLFELRSDTNGLGELPDSRFAQVFDRLIDQSGGRQPTGYDVLNASTNVLWHRDKSVTDLDYNESVVDQLLDYAREHTN